MTTADGAAEPSYVDERIDSGVSEMLSLQPSDLSGEDEVRRLSEWRCDPDLTSFDTICQAGLVAKDGRIIVFVDRHAGLSKAGFSRFFSSVRLTPRVKPSNGDWLVPAAP
jgi:hypothetical protein